MTIYTINCHINCFNLGSCMCIGIRNSNSNCDWLCHIHGICSACWYSTNWYHWFMIINGWWCTLGITDTNNIWVDCFPSNIKSSIHPSKCHTGINIWATRIIWNKCVIFKITFSITISTNPTSINIGGECSSCKICE